MDTHYALEGGFFEGYAILFDLPIRHPGYGCGVDIVRPGAFIDSITKKGLKDIKMFREHEGTEIGKWLNLAEDKKGLYVKGQLLLDRARAQEAHTLIRKGALTGLSIKFKTNHTGMETGGIRVLTKLDLQEISLVKSPRQTEARIATVMSNQASLTDLLSAIQRPLVKSHPSLDALLLAIKRARAELRASIPLRRAPHF